MNPAFLQYLQEQQNDLQKDLNMLQSLMERKKQQYIEVIMRIELMGIDIDTMNEEHTTVNCTPFMLDDEGRLTGEPNPEFKGE